MVPSKKGTTQCNSRVPGFDCSSVLASLLETLNKKNITSKATLLFNGRRRYKSTTTTTNSINRSPPDGVIYYALWEVILNGNSAVQMTKDEAGNEIEVPPVTAQQILARTRERKAKSTLLMAIPDEHLARFHGIKDAKTLWAAIKTRFGEGLDKGYDRFQRLLSMLDIHRAGASTEDANKKFLRSLPSAWSNISLIIRNNPGIDNLDIDDLYNNLKVYKTDIKGSSGLFSNSQNVAFVFTKSTNNTNELNAAYSVSTATNHSSQAQEGTLPEITDQQGIQGTGVEMLGMQEEEATDFALMDFTSILQAPQAPIQSAKVKTGLGYDSQFNKKEVLDIKEEEMTEIVFDNCLSDEENSLANDRFKKGEIYHAVSPPLTRKYMPPKHDLSFIGLDDSIYKLKISEIVASLTKNEKDAPKTSTACVEKPKEDRSSAPLIQDWDTNSDDDTVFRPEPILAKIDFVKAGESIKHVKPVEFVKHVKPIKYAKHVKPDKHVKTVEHAEKSKKFSSSPKVDRKEWNGKMTQKLRLGFGFTKKACFMCGSLIHLIKDYTFHEDRMAKKSVLPTNIGKGTGYKECRPVWNNVQRINHQKKFAPTAVFTRSGRIPVSTAKPKAAASTIAAKQVNTAGPKQSVNFSKSRISVVKGDGVTIVKTSSGCVWRPRVNEIDQLSKDNRALVTKTHNKTPYELLNGRTPRLDFMRPFGCPVTILNTLDPLGKFEGKADEGFLVGYSITCKAFRGIKLKNAGPQDTNGNVDAGKEVFDQHYISCHCGLLSLSLLRAQMTKLKMISLRIILEDNDVVNTFSKEFEQECMDQRGVTKAGSANSFNTVSKLVNAASTLGTFSTGGPSSPHPDAFIHANTLLHVDQDDSQIPNLEDTAKIQSTGIFNNAYDDDLDVFASPVQNVGAEADFNNIKSSTVYKQWGMEKKSSGGHAFVSYINKQRRTNHKDYENCLFACFLLEMEPKKVAQALDDESWVEAMNKKDKNGIVVRNKARLVAQGHRQEEGIDYDEVFAPVARIEAIMIFLVFASFMGCIVYQIDVKSAFLYGTIEEEMSSIGDLTFFLGLQVKQSEEGIFISQDKYVAKILKKFDLSSVKTASTLIETQKTLVKDEEATDVDVHLYRSMIGSLMYLTASRPDIMYLKSQPKLGLWYPRDSPFNLEAYSDSDYVRANLDRKPTTGGYQFLCRRLISWQCKKQTIVATFTTKAEYVVATNCCGQEIGLGDRHRRQETTLGVHMLRLDDLTDFVPPTPHDSPLLRGHIPGSDEGRPNLLELMNICTQLSNRVLALEEAKTTQDKVITRLKLRVRMLEKKRKARTSQPIKRRLFKGRVETSTDKSLGEDASKQRRNDDKTEELNLTDGADTEVTVEDKGNGEKGGSIADQVSTELDKAQKEKQKQKKATIVALTEEFDEIQAKMDADHKLAVRMTYEEQEKYTIEERARLLAKYFERRKKQLATERAEAIRNKPPIKSQVKNKMITYLKHMGNYTHQQLNHKTFEELQKLYQKEQMWINDFVPMNSKKEGKKLVEPESKDKKGKRIKRVADSALKQKYSKKQKMMQEQESTKSDEEESADYGHENKELRMWLIVVSNEEETVDQEILSTNYPRVDWESQISGNVDMEDLHVYKIIKANGNTIYHKSLSIMLRKFDRQDLVDLHRLVMKRFEDNTPEGYNLLLCRNLKSSYIADGWYFELLQHVSREKVSSHQGNAREDVKLEVRS
uniref:Uncharacterized mitochondrial protein AtMg00810-like n=1 Tax=Tanacetum cinerariifolium TaxID=118510 RepID=A0A6L2JYK8_TANCI|nr:uncharacterized mitochondrial protein AtMg00810-like [Tanacetum cinerariifolium]